MASSFFGLQLALDLPGNDPLRGPLGEVVRELGTASALAAQRPLWGRAAGLLRSALPHAALGTWDLIRTAADQEYEDWCSGLEAMAEWPMADFGDEGRYLLVSVILLVAGGSNADRTLGDRCDLAEPDWHLRSTYDRLIATLPLLNLTNVLASGLYLAPHPDQPGFSRTVLAGEGFEYLAPVR